ISVLYLHNAHPISRSQKIHHHSTCNFSRGTEQASNCIGKGGLATAALTGQTEDLPSLQGNAHVGEGMNGTVCSIVVHAHVFNLQQRVAGGGGCNESHQAATSLFLLRFASLGFGSVRRRGLAISSMPKLMKARPAPNKAMHKPGGTNH